VFTDPERMANGVHPLQWYAAELVGALSPAPPPLPPAAQAGLSYAQAVVGATGHAELERFGPGAVEHELELALEASRGEVRELRAQLAAANDTVTRLRRALGAMVSEQSGP
jgi:hypothetical protein